MIVYPDTSFILSLWHTGDSNYAQALKLFFAAAGDPIAARLLETQGWVPGVITPGAMLPWPCSVSTAWPRRYTGDMPACPRCGCEITLCFRAFGSGFCILDASFCFLGVFPVDEVLLPGKLA